MKRALFVVGFLLCALPAPAFAQVADLSAADRGAIRTVIEDQLAAFGRDDATAAFDLASPGIQRTFGTPERFMRMVKTSYQPVYRPRSVEFRDIVMVDEVPVQQVYVVGPAGESVIALYPMERQTDGGWKTAGCYLVRAPGENI